jgi:hypothetical protein
VALRAALAVQDKRLVLFDMTTANWLGMLEATHGASLEGIESIGRSLEFFHRSGSTNNLRQSIGYLGLVAARAKLYDEAAELYGVAEAAERLAACRCSSMAWLT